MFSKEYNTGLKILDKLRKSGFQAYFVGGVVRDMFVKLSIKRY